MQLILPLSKERPLVGEIFELELEDGTTVYHYGIGFSGRLFDYQTNEESDEDGFDNPCDAYDALREHTTDSDGSSPLKERHADSDLEKAINAAFGLEDHTIKISLSPTE